MNVFYLQVVATQAAADALAKQCAVLITIIRAGAGADPSLPSGATPSAPAPTSPALVDPAHPCDHPTNERYPCGRMGAPNAFMCRVCGEEVLNP